MFICVKMNSAFSSHLPITGGLKSRQHGAKKPTMPKPTDPRVVSSSATKKNPKKTEYMTDGKAREIYAKTILLLVFW